MKSINQNPSIIAHRLAVADLCTRAEDLSMEAARGFATLRQVTLDGSDDGEYDAPALREILKSFGAVASALCTMLPLPTFIHREGQPTPRMPVPSSVAAEEPQT